MNAAEYQWLGAQASEVQNPINEQFAMPRVNRTAICATGEIHVFYLINRCVRRTFALHWWRLFPQRRDGNGWAAEPLGSELKHILRNASGQKEKRPRLCDIWWFMRCLAEPIARRRKFEDV